MKLFLDSVYGQLFSSDGRVFSPSDRTWIKLGKGEPTGSELSPIEAVTWLQFASGSPCRVPVGVIGGREAGPEQLYAAEELGSQLAQMGLTLLCGGRQGIMEAACRGAAESDGISVGILPDADPAMANPHVTVPIATGIGVARNALVARAALCLVAVGGGYGTISEIAFGLQFKKNVFVLAGGPDIEGVRICTDVAHAADCIARTVLDLTHSQIRPEPCPAST